MNDTRHMITCYTIAMMVKFTIRTACFVLCLGLVAGNPLSRDKRQANQCFDDLTNVCIGVQPGNVIKFPHPSDNRKYLQCESGHRMFIIQCPYGEVYSRASLDCGVSQNHLQTTNPPASHTDSHAHPPNDCTEVNIQNGNIYFPNPRDNTTYYQCVRPGLLMPVRCSEHLIFDPQLKRCSLPPGTVLGSAYGDQLSPGVPGNPCTFFAVTHDQLYFPHTDPGKYFQCDLGGYAHVMQCPNNLIWNQVESKCVSRYDDPYVMG